MKEKAVSCAGLRDFRLTFSPAWLRNFVAACGLARSTAAYGGLRRRLWGLHLHASKMPRGDDTADRKASRRKSDMELEHKCEESESNARHKDGQDYHIESLF